VEAKVGFCSTQNGPRAGPNPGGWRQGWPVRRRVASMVTIPAKTRSMQRLDLEQLQFEESFLPGEEIFFPASEGIK
jgi:hypothetical protein